MRDKLKGILFLCKCTIYIARQLLASHTWNMITVNLDRKDGKRQFHTYKRQGDGSYVLDSWDSDHSASGVRDIE